jgi:hypothetical protein
VSQAGGKFVCLTGSCRHLPFSYGQGPRQDKSFRVPPLLAHPRKGENISVRVLTTTGGWLSPALYFPLLPSVLWVECMFVLKCARCMCA